MSPVSKVRESVIVARISKYLRQHGWFVTKIHGGAMQRSGLPDILAIKRGRYVWIEVKRPGGKLTELQKATHSILEGYGAEVWVARSVEEVSESAEGALDRWLKNEVE